MNGLPPRRRAEALQELARDLASGTAADKERAVSMLSSLTMWIDHHADILATPGVLDCLLDAVIDERLVPQARRRLGSFSYCTNRWAVSSPVMTLSYDAILPASSLRWCRHRAGRLCPASRLTLPLCSCQWRHVLGTPSHSAVWNGAVVAAKGRKDGRGACTATPHMLG